MTRIIFVIIIGFHGLIHLMGFVKAFNFAEIKELTQPISKSLGLIWFLVLLLFIATLIQYLIKNEFWWLTAIIGILVSQALVITFWHDAKFGTIPNVIILLVSIVAFAEFSFDRNVSQEIDKMFSQDTIKNHSAITTEMITHLPAPIQNWIKHSGLIGKERIYAVRLKQKALMKMKPEQEKWTDAYAEQYFTIDKPAFIWKVDMQMMPFLDIAGRDKFFDGKGEMLIKILSLFPVVNNNDNEKINTGTIQRYLGEIVWFPSAALSPYITWEKIDDFSAKALITYKGTTGSGVFYFDEKGNFVKYSAQRYMSSEDDAKLKEWIIAVSESRVMNGINIPVKLDATWKLESGDWTWLKLEITDIDYNNKNEYLENGKAQL